MPYTYQYPRPALTVDCVVFGYDLISLKLLLIRRKYPPFENCWAFPGGFVRVDETLDAAARRELEEESGVKNIFLEQLYTFGAVERDPRERVVSVAYYALISLAEQALKAATDACDAQWFAIQEVPELAFDHAEILKLAIQRLKAKVRYEPIGFELLPKKFAISQLRHLYETILEKPIDKRNFYKKVQSMNLLIDLNEYQQGVSHRAAKLYRFDPTHYEELKRSGFNFDL